MPAFGTVSYIEKTQIFLFSCSTVQRIPLYFCSDKVKSYICNIMVLKQVHDKAVCSDLLFLLAFTGCDSLCMLTRWGSNIIREKATKDCSKALSKKSQDVVETNGCKAMVALFNADQKNSRASIRYNMLRKKVARAKMFVTP